MQFKYETHLHTREVSKCGITPAADYVGYYKALGYEGIFVTDHFFNGNCGIDRELCWEDKVTLFCRGYEIAYEEGKKQGLSVFFGWECNFQNDEYLVYGLDKQWLLNHPEMMEWNQKEHFERIHADGGAIVQAHPFRVRDYIKRINLHPYHVDAVEVFNLGNHQENDALAYHYCKNLGLPMTSGSDIHCIPKTEKITYGVAFEHPLQDVSDYVSALKTGRAHRLLAEDGRENVIPDYIPPIPVYTHDYENREKRIYL